MTGGWYGQCAWIEHQGLALKTLRVGVRVPATYQIPLTRVDRIVQQLYVVAVQEGHVAAFDFQRPEFPVVGVFRILDSSVEPTGMIHVPVSEMGRQALQERDNVEADVAAMNQERHTKTLENTDGPLHGLHLAVRIAEYADFHQAIPEWSIRVGCSRGRTAKGVEWRLQERRWAPMLSAISGVILAICTLAALLGTFALWIVAKLRRWPFSPMQSALYSFNYVLTRVLCAPKWSARCPLLPVSAVIVCNHRCPLDPSFIGDHGAAWSTGWWPRNTANIRLFVGFCVRVKRFRSVGGVDTAATKAAIRLVQSGGLVGVFPEGRINTTRQTLLPGRPGAAMIALKVACALIPCYIHCAPYDGTTVGCLLMPASVRLVIGEPIDLSPYYERDGEREVLEEITHQLLREIARLAGEPDFRPQLAGRFYKPDES